MVERKAPNISPRPAPSAPAVTKTGHRVSRTVCIATPPNLRVEKHLANESDSTNIEHNSKAFYGRPGIAANHIFSSPKHAPHVGAKITDIDTDTDLDATPSVRSPSLQERGIFNHRVTTHYITTTTTDSKTVYQFVDRTATAHRVCTTPTNSKTVYQILHSALSYRLPRSRLTRVFFLFAE
jgi:hypothetical protein